MGPVYVANWITWRSQAFHDGWQWFLLPNGEPAIEVPVEIDFDNVLVKGYIDRVMVNPNGEVVVVDLKSGSRVPASTLQLGTYALGVKRKFDVTATLGSYWMARTGQLTEPASLLHYTPEIVGGWYGSAKKAIEAEVFIPHVGPFCGSCAVSPYCTAVGGDPAPLTKLKKMAEDNANPPF
jgi:putative RecB family exonuclease